MRFLSTRLQNTCFLVECMISNWKHNDSKVWKHFWYYIYLKPQNASLIRMQCKPKTAYRKLTSLKMYLIWNHFSLYKVFCTLMWNTHPSQSQIHSFPPAYYPLSWGFWLKSLLISWILWHQIIRERGNRRAVRRCWRATRLLLGKRFTAQNRAQGYPPSRILDGVKVIISKLI